MISRTLLASLRYKPDYIVLVSDDNSGAPFASGLSMASMLELANECPKRERIQALAERGGLEPLMDCMANNILGRRLTELCGALADRGFFSDERNRVKYGRDMPCYSAVAGC